MKSMTKLIVVAMILAAALVVAPVAARTIDTTGDTVYIGEKTVDLTKVLNGTPALPFTKGNLVYYSSISSATSGTVGKTIPVTEAGAAKFEVDATNFETRLGTWYAFNQSTTDFTNLTMANGNFLVDKPSATLDVKLWNKGDNKMSSDSVKDKSVSRGDEVAFEIKHNIRVDSLNYDADGFVMTIEVKMPDGSTVTRLGTVNLAKLPLTGTSINTTNITLSDLKAGAYVAQAKWANTTVFEPAKPAAATFEIRSKSLAVTSSKDSVVRGNNFLVTITGESLTNYNVFIKGPESTPEENPMIGPNQPSITPKSVNPDTNVTARTDAAGKREVGFNTTTSTKDKTFTIRVVNENDPNDNDEIKVKVEAGSVTITTSGTGTYYIGEEITLSGTCTENETVYLFMTGPNFASTGVNLTDLGPVTNGAGWSFTQETVKADDTWSRKWNTADLVTKSKSIDAGGYTIYAVSAPKDKNHLSEAKYSTASVNLRSGFISATTSGATVAKGDDLKITGIAQGNPLNVFVWIFGKNYYGKPSDLYVRQASVESDGSFELKLGSSVTKDLAAGQYFVIVQHPMGVTGDAGSIHVTANGEIWGGGISSADPIPLTGLQAPAAASALINLLDSPNVPDTYVKLTFVVAEPNLFIDPIGTKTAGSKFTISGTTNLAVGDTLNVEVTSAAFQPGSKTEASGFSSSAGNAVVQKGDGANKWSFEVDATSFKPDQYIVKVESIETSTTATATFNVVAGGEPTTPPEGNVTTTTTTATTTTATTTTAATPTTTPGFGALVALAGLGAVAFLVLRRK